MRVSILFLLFVAQMVAANQEIKLSLSSQLDGGHSFYHELLFESLTDLGYKVSISSPSEHIPQKRVVKMVESGALTLTWLLPTPERDERFVVVPVPLTNGMIGKRILLIPPQLQSQFDAVNSLDELQRSGLVAGLGINWFDVAVWKTNQLPVYLADGEWRSLYRLISTDGKVNYFPRGLNEIVSEAELNPHLAIEQRLMLQYDRDFYFYLSPQAKEYQPIIERALRKAKSSGLLDKIITKHWGRTFQVVDPAKRVVIRLTTPNAKSQNN
ncbi:hypothetical protein [Vibrio sp. 16]|uniref:hypothetical protein n=1 Tax=Vibrio sp. 16 TaxID=391586 RepID=UPI00018F2ED8|nr:hypothetical protein [Vibrio sp. 16]EED26078.1 conserved hypothetical protein [Vibrio sp. 16]CAK4068092.1 hypothetical protein VDT1_0944 [Vibrio sp. 16]